MKTLPPAWGLVEVFGSMSETETKPVASTVADSLFQSFRQVPPVAVPAMMDCVLTSSGLAPSSLLLSLMDAFPTLHEDVASEHGKLDFDKCDYLSSYVGAVCHLLKKPGESHNYMQLFIYKCYIPLMKMVPGFDGEILSRIGESFFGVLIETNNWAVIEATLVPLFLRSVGLSMGMLQNDELTIYRWSSFTVFKSSNETNNISESDGQYPNGNFPLPVSCHILTLILNAALQSCEGAKGSSKFVLTNGCSYAEKVAANMLWDLCNTSIQMLLQSMEHRSCALGSLLPCIFRAFVVRGSFEIMINEQRLLLSRKQLLKKLWICCKTLFSMASSERGDAYSVLSLYLSFFSSIVGSGDTDVSDGAEDFDIRTEKEFWNEIKRGLVDEEGIVRKQCLHILKTALQINETSNCCTDSTLHGKESIQNGMTRRELWADEEAKSLGVGKICNHLDNCLNGQQRWEAFLLLYEMLEEYGIHLVEAAWTHQITMLLHNTAIHDDFLKVTRSEAYQNQMESLEGIYDWLGILWERGFCHDNPQVRCLVMQSFLGFKWKNLESYAKLVPESFVLGPLILALNDPVQHKDFGVRGVYSSRTIEGAIEFYCQYTSLLSVRSGITFLKNLASVAKQHSFGRAGLMGLVKCIGSAARGVQARDEIEPNLCKDNLPGMIDENKTELLDVLRFLMESSKQHFNPKYRLQVCENVLEAAASLVCTFDVPLEALLHFISAVPREFIDYIGSLRVKVQEWLLEYGKNHNSENSCTRMWLLASIYDFPARFINHLYPVGSFYTYDDEDLDSWESESRRWARLLFLVIEEEHDLEPLLMFIQNHGTSIGQGNKHLKWEPLKLLILILSLVQEIQLMNERTSGSHIKVEPKTEFVLLESVDQSCRIKDCILTNKFTMCFLSILEDVVSFANLSCSIFWSKVVTEDTILPSSVTGKLGGPSQRRLSSSLTTAVLKAITSMKTVASVSSWCAQFVNDDASLKFTFTFLWKSFWKIISSPTCDSEAAAEVLVAAYEASAAFLKALVFGFSPALDFVKEYNGLLAPEITGKTVLDTVVLTFLQNINSHLCVGVLARSRRAILMNWKWLCLESLLSIADNDLERGGHLDDTLFYISETTARCIFADLVESLENAGEVSVLPMLRSVRLVLGWFASGKLSSIVSLCGGMNTQMIWKLVRASWILHVSCSKRRIAPIAALLSSVLHPYVFCDENMHGTVDSPGPLKWFVEKLLEEGTKSPRTIRLAALHLTGLWLLNPKTIKYYMKELKLLSLYGSVAFDEDFEVELSDNHDAWTEVSLLGKSPDPELTAAFINTELYARVSVAVLFYKLADLTDMVGATSENDIFVIREAGKLFLLELLDSVVTDKDLAKELYKKYSGIHRRKVRAWQMLCILSHFIDRDIVEQVSQSLHICLYRNNLPAVRQYLETFAIHVYLKFPSLANEQLVAIFRDYGMKPQALSSYVFIAANIILHSPETVQYKHLDELLPPIIPLLTSHHHSLRGFTQVLVYQVLRKLCPSASFSDSESVPLEKRCFEDLKLYLAENLDCMRLRASMIGYLDAFDPKLATSPAGIFSNRIEELEFECVPKSLMGQVTAFLNDVREDLRCSMAKDLVSIKNQSLMAAEYVKSMETVGDTNEKYLLSQHVSLDFQKKVTFSKHEHPTNSGSSGNSEAYKQLLEVEKEDQLLEQLLQPRSLAMEKLRASRQDIIIVASLLDRIPNLAGLARSCEVFKAAGLAVADTNILQDKQFQLISVTAEKWVPIIEVPVNSMKIFLEKKKREGFSILGLEQTANSTPIDRYIFPKKMVLVLGREKKGIPVNIIHILDACIEIPQLGIVRSLNVHVSGAIALWEYTRQQRFQ